jgi:hypothetical protein
MAAQVHHRNLIQSERSEVGLDPRSQVLRSLCAQPVPLLIASRPHLGDEYQLLWIGMQRLAEELVRHIRSIELSRVDVIDPGVDGTTDDGQRLVAILRWSEHPGPRELHRAKTHAADRTTGKQNGFVGHGAILP